METYIISDVHNTERHIKEFNNLSDARTWTQNHLDMSKSWNCDRLEWIVTQAYKTTLGDK